MRVISGFAKGRELRSPSGNTTRPITDRVKSALFNILAAQGMIAERRYLDLFERRDGTWKIIRRRGMSDWTSPVTPAASPFASQPPGTYALRSKDDEYYRMLALFEAG